MSERVQRKNFWHFLEDLSAGVKVGTSTSTEQLIERCRAFYTAKRMAGTEAAVPGWTHMASYENGKTLWHYGSPGAIVIDSL